MKTLSEKINELNELVRAGRPLDAFEKFYHPHVVMQENENEPVVGKEANLIREREFFSNAKNFHERAQVLDVAVGNDVTMVRWSYDYDHAEWGKKKYTQVSVQHWSEGQIIREQFFYAS
ncbi:MAG TPA: nuclear transport factor 2 family protein [Cyclobacteriaceae bacterium]|nr:nuclear transport factor 2 family protein [Cyclobacteriaceae bacterium]